MKRILQWLAGGVVVLGLLGLLLAGVLGVIVGRWLTPDYLEAELEKQLACDAEIGAVEYHLLRPGQPAQVTVKDLRLSPSADSVKRLLAEGGASLTEEQRALVEALAKEPVLTVGSAQLQIDRGGLLQRRVDINQIVVDQPVVRVVSMEGLGSTLQALVKPKPVRTEPAPTTTTPAPKPKDEPQKPTLLNLRSLVITNGQVEFSELDPSGKIKPGEEAKEPTQIAVQGLNFSLSDVALGSPQPLEIPFQLAGLLTVEQGMEKRWLALDLAGGGKINFPDPKKRDLEHSSWEIDLKLGPDSFFWGGDLIQELRKNLATFSRLGLVSEDWQVSEQGRFLGEQHFALQGEGTKATLQQPLQANFDEAWIRVDAGGTFELAGEMPVNLTGRLRPPAELADGAYQKIPEALDSLGGLAGGSWEKIRSAYFVGEELQLPLVSKSTLSDFEVKIEPEPLDLMEGLGTLISEGENLLNLLRGDETDQQKEARKQREREERREQRRQERREERRRQRELEQQQQQQQAVEAAAGGGAAPANGAAAPAGGGTEGGGAGTEPGSAEAALEASLESAATSQ